MKSRINEVLAATTSSSSSAFAGAPAYLSWKLSTPSSVSTSSDEVRASFGALRGCQRAYAKCAGLDFITVYAPTDFRIARACGDYLTSSSVRFGTGVSGLSGGLRVCHVVTLS